MDDAAIRRTSELLGTARLASAEVPEIVPADTPATAADAYTVQAALHRWFAEHGQGTPAGWKIGATTRGMQKYLGVDGPAFGRIFSRNVLDNGATLSADRFCNPGIECEIAVRIARNATAPRYDRASAADLVAAVLPAIEIVENRYGDFLARGTPTLIADDFFHKAAVLGADIAAWRDLDLAAAIGRTTVDGAERGKGTGADVLGHPLEAVAWLANALRDRGKPLAEGEIVLTGSLAPVIWLDSFPCEAAIEIDGLGRVEGTFA